VITARAITREIDALPAFSGAVARVNALLDAEDSAAEDYEQAFQVDAALTAGLLRLANSPYFGCRAEIFSVRQAVALLGTERIRKLVLSAAFQRVLPERLPGYGVDAAAFWTHCVAVGAIGESLARALKPSRPEIDPKVVFTAGLLHDVGKLVLCTFVEREADGVFALIDRDSATFVDAESRVLGVNHPEAGALVVGTWGLPEEFVAVARYHHQPDAAPEALQWIVDAVHAGDALAYLFGYGTDAGELAREVSPGAARRLGLKTRQLEEIACETQEWIAEAGAALKLR